MLMGPNDEREDHSSILAYQISIKKTTIVGRIKAIADFIGDCTKIWLLLSIVISMTFVGNYLAQFDMPFVPTDNVLTVVVPIFTVVFVCIALLTTVYIIFPLTLRYVVSFEVMRALPELFPKAAVFNEDDRTSRKFQLRKFLWEYIQFYFPLVSIEFTILYLVVFSPNYRIDALILNEVLIGVFVFGFCWIVSELRYKSFPYSWKSDILYWYII